MDIEEIANDFHLETGHERSNAKNSMIFPRSSAIDRKIDHDLPAEESKSYIPGSQSIWVKTYGCSHNVSDSEYMEGMLSTYGYQVVDQQADADLWLINSCTVKDPSQAAFMHLVNKAKDQGKPLVLAGCVPQADRKLAGIDNISVVGVTQIDRVVEVVERTLNGENVRLLGKKELPKLDLPKIRKNPLIEIIPLSTGCLGSCTYCKTKHARGKLGSYALNAIVSRVEEVVKEGVSEIWLSSEDTGAYGRDIGTNIAELLRAIIAVLPEDGVMLRVGMTNPPYMMEHLDAIAEILNHPKVYAFLHVPVQSGSNRVLHAMNREYTVEDFRLVVDSLHAKVPGVTIATDIICGFPNETEADFDETLALIAHYKLAIVNISQFYPRPGTPAAKMKRIPTQLVKVSYQTICFSNYRSLTTLVAS
jgi:threonylcarbamoyladenosine tRNA methylthiotransferase CDKAL1